MSTDTIYNPQTNKDDDKRPKLLYGVIGLLVFLMIVQTGAFLFYLNKKDKAPENPGYRAYNQQLPQTPMRSTPPPMRHSLWADPWTHMARMEAQMNRLFDNFFTHSPGLRSAGFEGMGAGFSPTADLEEKDGAYVLKFDLPGLDKDKINITVRGNLLTVQGVREAGSETRDQENGYYAQERTYGSFARTISLPGPVDENNVKAEYQQGVLTISLPKLNGNDSTKKVSIQ